MSYLRLLRVAPLKHITIPRLELTAAVLAVHVDKLLWKQINFKLENPVGLTAPPSSNTFTMKQKGFKHL